MTTYRLMKLRNGFIAALMMLATTTLTTSPVTAATLSNDDIDNLVRRSYQYVAMYNLIHKFAHQRYVCPIHAVGH